MRNVRILVLIILFLKTVNLINVGIINFDYSIEFKNIVLILKSELSLQLNLDNINLNESNVIYINKGYPHHIHKACK